MDFEGFGSLGKLHGWCKPNHDVVQNGVILIHERNLKQTFCSQKEKSYNMREINLNFVIVESLPKLMRLKVVMIEYSTRKYATKKYTYFFIMRNCYHNATLRKKIELKVYY